jgi:hypothetical protein
MEKSSPKMLAASVAIKKLPNVKKSQIGEKLPNMVTLGTKQRPLRPVF